MLNESLITNPAAVKDDRPSLETILRAARAARSRVECEEWRDLGSWDERASLGALLGEVVEGLKALCRPAPTHAPPCPCLELLHAPAERFDCAECYRNLPLCLKTDVENFPLCSDCFAKIEERGLAA